MRQGASFGGSMVVCPGKSSPCCSAGMAGTKGRFATSGFTGVSFSAGASAFTGVSLTGAASRRSVTDAGGFPKAVPAGFSNGRKAW